MAVISWKMDTVERSMLLVERKDGRRGEGGGKNDRNGREKKREEKRRDGEKKIQGEGARERERERRRGGEERWRVVRDRKINE